MIKTNNVKKIITFHVFSDVKNNITYFVIELPGGKNDLETLANTKFASPHTKSPSRERVTFNDPKHKYRKQNRYTKAFHALVLTVWVLHGEDQNLIS